MSLHSRHARYKQSTVSHNKRPRQLYGEKDDTGKWYRCWNCGMRVHADRTARVDSMGNGVVVEYVTDAADLPAVTTVGSADGSVWLTESMPQAITITSNGELEAVARPVSIDVEAGCPFCGTLNWR